MNFENKPYFEPDIRWEIYGISSYADFEKRFVVKEKFHPNVHEDIIKDYEIVIRLMIYSYFYYPMYDESLRKLLGMTEMAVKIRCSQLGIKLNFIDRNDKTKQHNLSKLMVLLLRKEPNKPLKFEFEKARKVRNIFAHPNQHAFTGAIAYLSIIQVINTINFIFLDDKTFFESKESLKRLADLSNPYKQGDFILEYNNESYLIFGLKCIEVQKVKNELISFWVFYPVTTKIKSEIEEHKYSKPFYLSLKNVIINDSTIKALDTKTQNSIQVVAVKDQINVEACSQFKKELNSCQKQDVEIYFEWLNVEMGNQLVLHRYNNYWN